jgi:hypothetical protein
VTRIDRAAHRPTGSAPARLAQIAGALLIDLGALAGVVGLVAAAAASGSADLTVLAVLGLIGLAVGQTLAWARSGRGLGARVVGTRRVSAADGAPPGFAGALAPTWIADLRRGRDPVDPERAVPLLPPPGAAPAAAAPVPTAAASEVRPAERTSRALLVVDGRVAGAIGDGVVLGRNPTASGDERTVAIADISREISKAHLSLRLDDEGRVWALDRQSTNGSTLEREGTTTRLTPGRETELAPGDVVRIGGHTVAVQYVTEVRMAAR